MANMVDYLAWRGDLPFSAAPWNEIDGLLMATISYLNFHGDRDPQGWTMEEMARIDLIQPGTSASFPGRKAAFEAMAGGERFRSGRVHHAIALTDGEMGMQFSALCADLPDGTLCVAFRGTDNTVIGWREDFNMAFTTRVPAQEAAAFYLTRAAALSDRPIRLVGHSKGGNLAVYAAAFAPEEVQERIEGIWTYDGPGMNRENAQTGGYLRIRDRIHSYIPQTSIIGLLMDYYDPYTVVRSTASGILQHDPMTWQVYGPRFETLKEVDRTAAVTRDTLHEWLRDSTPEQRATFVDTMFSMVESTNATRISDLTGEKLRSLMAMAGSRKEADPETRRIFNRLVGQAITLGFGNVIERVRGRREEPEETEWETLTPEQLKELKEETAAQKAGEAAKNAGSGEKTDDRKTPLDNSSAV